MSFISMEPDAPIETGSLPKDLIAGYQYGVKIAEVADSLSRDSLARLPEGALRHLHWSVERLAIGDVKEVFKHLTANSQEMNSVRDHPVSYRGFVFPNAHLVCMRIWDYLLFEVWQLATRLGLWKCNCAEERWEFDVCKPSAFKSGHGRAIRDHFSKLDFPRAGHLLSELQLEVSKVVQRRNDACQSLEIFSEHARLLVAGKSITGQDDDSAYRPAKEFLSTGGFPKNFAELHRALADNTWIRWKRPISERTGRPVSNRAKVHAGDWHEFLERRKQATPDPLDLPAHVVDAAIQEVEARKAQARARRAAD